MHQPAIHPQPKVSQRDIIRRGIRCQCPNCGYPELFKSLIRIHRHCPRCGMMLERGDGYFLGPLCINYGMIAFFFVSPVLIAGYAGWLPLRLALVIALAGALLLPFLIYRLSWSWWLMVYYLCLPDELHANRGEDCDDLSFEEEPRVRK